MVERTIVAFDSESLIVQSSSSAGLVGNPIINNSDTPNGTTFLFSGGFAEKVTLDDTAGNPDTFEDDQSAGHTIIEGGGLVANGTGVEAESIIELRALDANGAQIGPTIFLTVFSQNANFSDVWAFSTTIQLTPGVTYVKTAGSNAGSSDYIDFVTCFGPGTLIQTPRGQTLIDDIKPGDLVWTLDNGPMPVRWVSRTTINGSGAFAPGVISPGALGKDQELIVSQEHRMYFDNPLVSYLFGADDMLVAAKHLCHLPGIDIQERDSITYAHFMFDRHEVVRANGVLSESFFLSKGALSGLENDARNELLALFPDCNAEAHLFSETAAKTLKQHEAALWCRYAAAA
jgi:hypothetical protein